MTLSMTKNDKSKTRWLVVFVNYKTFSINKQLFFTKKTSDTLLKFIKNDFNDKKREIVFKITAVAMLKMISSIANAIVNQFSNKALFATIQALKQFIKKIEENTTCLKHKTNSVIITIRSSNFMKIWQKKLSVVFIFNSHSFTNIFLQSISSMIFFNEKRQIIIKIKNREIATQHRKKNFKQLRTFIKTRLQNYSIFKTTFVEICIFLSFENIRLLIKTREKIETLKNVKNVKTWIACFDKNAFVLIFSYDIIIHNVLIQQYQFFRDDFKLINQIVIDNAHIISKAEIRYVDWLDKNNVKNQKIFFIIAKFIEDRHVNTVWRKKLTWNEMHHDCEKYVRKCRIIKCFKCQKFDHITTQCKISSSTCAHCAHEHDIRNCAKIHNQEFIFTCVNCKNKHKTFDTKCFFIAQLKKKTKMKRLQIQTSWSKYSMKSNDTIIFQNQQIVSQNKWIIFFIQQVTNNERMKMNFLSLFSINATFVFFQIEIKNQEKQILKLETTRKTKTLKKSTKIKINNSKIATKRNMKINQQSQFEVSVSQLSNH